MRRCIWENWKRMQYVKCRALSACYRLDAKPITGVEYHPTEEGINYRFSYVEIAMVTMLSHGRVRTQF